MSHGCKVINFSVSASGFNRTAQQSITNAIARGAIFVTVAGNEGASELELPGYIKPCITVGATNRVDRRAGFSNSGAQIDLVAPGVDIATVGLSGELKIAESTSLSAPLVAGVCALQAALHSDITQDEASWLLAAGAEDGIGDPREDVPGFNHYHGWGRLNAYNSLLLATTHIDDVRCSGGSIELSWVSPSNAPDKHPWKAETAGAPGGPWLPATGVFGYSKRRSCAQ